MQWNWQQKDWPDFTWNTTRLERAETQFLVDGGIILGSAEHLSAGERSQLLVELLSSEALDTSEIEGDILDRPSVQSSIRRQLGLVTDHRRVPPGEQGIAEMTVDACQRLGPLAEDTLFAWHAMVTNGRTDLQDIGRYRTGDAPMQVVSGRLDAPKVHYEAPPSAQVPSEMREYLKWLDRTAAGGEAPLPALTRVGIAHLYFESIHPFEDGNGRIGRAIAERVLSQSLGRPLFIALSSAILARRGSYYQAIEAASKANEITHWLTWFAGIVLEAQQRTLAQTEFIIDKARLFERLHGSVNERQEKALIRIFREGPQGFKGGLSASNYTAITGAAESTATRDLADLTNKEALTKEGERRYARYHLNVRVKPIKQIIIDTQGNITEA